MAADGYEHMRTSGTDGYGQMGAPAPDGYGQMRAPMPDGYGQMRASVPDGYGQMRASVPDGYGQMRASVPDGYGRMRASTADRERAIDVLKAAFAEGRLTAEEYQERVGQVYASRTYAELGMLTSDLPIGPLGALAPPRTAQLMVPTRRPMNSLAIVSLICALIPGLPSAAAVVTGVVARSQIRETGERGAGMAAAGIAIGSFVLVLFLLFLVAA